MCLSILGLIFEVFYLSVEIARERFINMRTTFMNNEKRIRESKQRCSGKGADEIYKPKWSLYTNLLFLKKACVQTESSSNLDVFEDDDNQACITTTDTNEEINNNLLAHSVKKNIYFDSNLQVIITRIELISSSFSKEIMLFFN